MSKILVIFYQQIFDNDLNNFSIFYESLVKELSGYGNEVKIINNVLLKENWVSEEVNILPKNKEILIDDLKKFNPDLIISFNNQIFQEIIVNTNCPILIFQADSIDFFTGKQLIRQYLDRYYFATFCGNLEMDKIRSLSFEDKKILNLNLSTSVKNEKIAKDKNISFIGSNFHHNYDEITPNNDMYTLLKKFWNECNFDYDKLGEEFCNRSLNYKLTITDSRLIVLNSLLDLDLKLYGVCYELLPKEFFHLKSAFIKKQVYSLKHNQDIYNSSKISISISHPQTKGYGFPWRIYDIMASNSLLITSTSRLLNEYTKGYVKIPMYDNPYDARDLCKKYLNEPNLREDIIAASNEYVEKNCRWEINFKIIEDELNIKLLNKKSENGHYDFLYDKPELSTNNRKKKILYYYKKSYFNIVFFIMKILLCVPFASTEKIIKKINKYKRIENEKSNC